MPSRESPEYAQLMRAVGAPEDLVKAGVVRPHWPALCDLLTARASEGKGPLPGINQTYTVYHLSSLKLKKGVVL